MMLEEKELEKILNRNRLKFSNKKVTKSFKNWNKSVLYYFSDSDEYYHFKLENGVPQPLKKKKINSPNIKYEMSTETFKLIDEKKMKGMVAYRKKLVKVKAKMTDLIKLQKLENL